MKIYTDIPSAATRECRRIVNTDPGVASEF
jgi:hypothetical protein